MYIKLSWYDINKGKSGFEFYGEQVYDNYSELKSYKFNFELGAYFTVEEIINQMKLGNNVGSHFQPIEKENIIFYDTIKLTDLCEKDDSFSLSKVENFLSERHPTEYKVAKERLNKKLYGTIPEPIIYNDSGPDIFLEFMKETAHCWGGPHKLNDKLGAILKVKENKPEDYVVDLKDFSYYNLPKHLEKQTSDKEIYNMSKEEKHNYFDSLSAADKHYIAKRQLQWIDKEWLESKLPFKIYLSGNDDTSFSKWFATKKEVQEEINYLLKMQPLCMHKDIYDRDYIFTN